MSGVFKIRGVIKSYEWGKLGADSCVSQLYKSAFSDFEVEERTPYAELWMGTHPSGMATIPSMDDMSLMDWIAKNTDSLGSNITNNFDACGLPFLFKVLSVRKALSIQVHPDKSTAKILHRDSPDKYPDDNHKPELAVALTPFQALCGFRPLSEIKSFVEELPQLQEVIGLEKALCFLNKSGDNVDLKTVFTAMITSAADKFKKHLQDLVHHLEDCSSLSDLCKSVKNVFLKVHEQFPGDIGCFCVFFLNHIVLQPGQSIFLAANEPHAYLEGDCIECMACSDNVVRAGLTPKFKDVETLCHILTYKCRTAEENIFQGTSSAEDPNVMIYDPPIPEFAVARIEVQSSENVYALEALKSASLLLVVEGDGVALTCDKLPIPCGTILFISSDTELKIHVSSSKIIMYRAFCNEK